MSKWQQREAKRLGLDRIIEAVEATGAAWLSSERRAREIRAENMRRTVAAS